MTPLLPRETLRQFVIFTAIGGVGTGGQYLTLIGLVEGNLLDALPASIIGFFIGAIINYLLNYRFTFNSSKSHKEAMGKFFVVATLGAGINTSLMYVGINILQMYYLLPQIAATGIVLVWNFAVNKMWTFKPEL